MLTVRTSSCPSLVLAPAALQTSRMSPSMISEPISRSPCSTPSHSLPLIHSSALPHALELVTTRISFDQDVKVQVFEMTIRVVGSLLSTYQSLDAMVPRSATVLVAHRSQRQIIRPKASLNGGGYGRKASSCIPDTYGTAICTGQPPLRRGRRRNDRDL